MPDSPHTAETCPFCRSPGSISDGNNGLHFRVICGKSSCRAAGPLERCAADAIAAWNTRTPDPEAAAEIKALREAAEVGLEWVIEAANERRQKDAVFDNAMRDIKRIEAALKDHRKVQP